MKLRVIVLVVLGLILFIAVLSMAQRPTIPTLQERVSKDLETERARFRPENSVDIGMAMKLITFDPPRMLNPPTPPPPQLLYPPSEETLARMSGV